MKKREILRRDSQPPDIFRRKDHFTAPPRLVLCAFHTARDRITGRWMETMRRYYEADASEFYYLSMEFLIGPPVQ